MTASPLVQVQFSSDPGNWHDTPGGVDIVPGDTVSIRLSDTTSVGAWYVTVVGVDEFTATHPVLVNVSMSPDTLGLVVSPTSIVSFTPPAGHGRAYILRSSVNGPSSNTTFGIFVRTPDGFRVGAVGERFEGDPNFGWTTTLNQFIRSGGGGGGGPASALQTTTGNVNVAGASAPSPGEVLTAVDSTHATWQPGGGGAPTGPAGGDLGGTYPNPQVAALVGNQIVGTGGSPDLNLGLPADLIPGYIFGPLPGSGDTQHVIPFSQYNFVAIRKASVVVVNVDHVDPTVFTSTVIELTNTGATLDLNLITILNGVYDGSRYLWFVGDYNGTSFYLWKVDSTLVNPVVAYQLSLSLPSVISQLTSITYTNGLVIVGVHDSHDTHYKLMEINPATGAATSVVNLPLMIITPTPGVDLTIPVGSNPRGVGSDGTHIYVCNPGNNTVSRILIATGAVDQVISSSDFTDPTNCLWDGGDYVYVANFSSGIVKVSVSTGMISGTISIPGCIGMAKDNSGHIYAIDSSSNAVYKIRISDGTVLTSIDLTSLGTGYKNWIAFDNVQYMYVTDYTNGIIRIDTITDTIFDTIAYAGMSSPIVVEWDHAGYMYIGNEDQFTISRIKISDISSDTQNIGSYAPVGFAWDGDHHMYVSPDGANSAVAIDTTNFMIDNFIPIGNSPWGIVWDGQTHIYVANSNDNTVSRINISSTPFTTSLVPDVGSVTSNADYSWFSGFLLSTQSRLSRFNPSLTAHKVNDTANIETHPIATDLNSAQVLLNSLKAKYLAHLTQAGVHLVDDTDFNSTVGFSDATDSATPVTFPLCAALANNLKLKFNAHLTQTGVHATNDTVNTITTPNATASSLSSIITLVNAIGYATGFMALNGKYNAHLSQKVGGNAVHQVDDWVDTEASPIAADITTLKGLLLDLVFVYTQHIESPVFHLTADTVNEITASTDLSTDVGQYQTSTDLANSLKACLNYHMLKSGVHYHYDQSLVTTPDANANSYTDLAGVVALANAIGYGSTHGAYNAHLSKTRNLVHKLTVYSEFAAYPSYQDLTETPSSSLLYNTETILNAFQTLFNSHLVYPGVHLGNDTVNNSTATQANDNPLTWWPTAANLANTLKDVFNAHASNNGGDYHSTPDTTNLITVPYASSDDLLSIIDLTNALGYAIGFGGYNQHRTATSSPGVFIHQANDQVNVEALPYGDGVISAVTLFNVQSRLNDLVTQYTNHIDPGGSFHYVPDVTNIITAPAATDEAPDFPTTYAIAVELKAKFNAHLTQTGVHFSNDTTSTITDTQSINLRAFFAPDPEDSSDLTSIVNIARALATYGYYGVPTGFSNSFNGAYDFHLTQSVEFWDTGLDLTSGNTIELKWFQGASDYNYVVVMAQDSSGYPYFYVQRAQDVDGGVPNPVPPGGSVASWNFTSVTPQCFFPKRFALNSSNLLFISGGVPNETTLPYTINRTPNFSTGPVFPYTDLNVAIPSGLVPTDIAEDYSSPIRVSYDLGDYVGDFNDSSGARDELAKYPMGGALGFSPLASGLGALIGGTQIGSFSKLNITGTGPFNQPTLTADTLNVAISPAGTWSATGNQGLDEVQPSEILPSQLYSIFFDIPATNNPLGIMTDKMTVKAVSMKPGADPSNPADFDGVSLNNGDRVLLTRESPGNNGVRICYYGSLYNFAIPWMTCGFQVFVTNGEIFGGKTFRQVTPGDPTATPYFPTQVWECDIGPHIAPPLSTYNGSGGGVTWFTLDTIPGPPDNGYDLIVVTDSVATNTSTGDNLQRERGAVTYHLAGGTLSQSDDSRALTSSDYFKQVISGNSVLLQIGRQSSGNNYSFRVRAWFEYVRSV